MMPLVYLKMQKLLNELAQEIEQEFDADCLLFHGQIHPARVKIVGKLVNDLSDIGDHDRLVVILQTTGGLAETTEKMVDIIRYCYDEVYFIVPRYAMSAGTIFCMSGDKIFMDHESSLGPIDPQVSNGKTMVPAQGYLDQYEKLVRKSRLNLISPGEFQQLVNTDLADLSRYEQAKNLTVTLLKQWLKKYKFKNWTEHRTTNPGQPVTETEKEERAEQIAKMLGDNQYWHSHGRYINIDNIRDYLRLEIDDYPSDTIRGTILEYNDLAEDFMVGQNLPDFFHTRLYF